MRSERACVPAFAARLLEAWHSYFGTTRADERVAGVSFDADRLIVDLMDGGTISVPVAWYPRLHSATAE